MKMLLMYNEFLSEISSDFIDVGGIKTAYYFYDGNSDKTILLRRRLSWNDSAGALSEG